MKNKLTLLIFSILLISSISALDFSIQSNNEDVSNAVIFNTYTIYLSGNLSGNLTSNYPDTLTLLNDYGEIRIYEWAINSQAGERTFQIGEDTFTFPVISEVDEMLNQITNFKIFVGEDNSYIETNFNLDGTTQEMQFIEYQGYSANINFANLLNGLNAKIELEQGETYPIVDYLKINSSTAITVVQAILIEEGHDFFVSDINTDPQYYLNYLIDYYNLQHEYEETSIIEKNNNYYKIQANYGYSSIDGDLETQIQEFVESKLEHFTPLDIVDELFKFTEYNLSEYVNLDYDYEIAIDFNNLILEDGSYLLTFLYEDSHGNTGKKDFNVILDITEEVIPEPEPECISGETNCDGEYYFVCINNNWINYGKLDGYCDYKSEPENETEETYIPSNPIILDYINKVSGLKNGIEITIDILENPSVPTITNTKVFKYLNITTNQKTSGEIYFHVLKSKVNDKNKVSLYVLENSWVKLTTTYLDENSLYYNYKAYTLHFSIFMMAEDTYVAPSSSHHYSSSGGGSYQEPVEPIKPNIISGGVPIEIPIDVIDDTPKPEQSKTIYIILGIISLGIILVILIISLILKERKKKVIEFKNEN